MHEDAGDRNDGNAGDQIIGPILLYRRLDLEHCRPRLVLMQGAQNLLGLARQQRQRHVEEMISADHEAPGSVDTWLVPRSPNGILLFVTYDATAVAMRRGDIEPAVDGSAHTGSRQTRDTWGSGGVSRRSQQHNQTT